MKHKTIQRAYERIQPDQEIRERMLRNILESDGQAVSGQRLRTRRMLLMAICAALVAVLSLTAYTVYQKWSLPEPKTYEDGNQGIYEVHQEQEYHSDDLGSNQTAHQDVLTDEAFIRKAIEILEKIGADAVDTDTITVRQQINLLYNREETEVTFGDSRTTVCFLTETGALLSMSSIDWIDSGIEACKTQEEAERLAETYYRKLPVQQGYILTGCTQYDEQYWSFEFCRRVSENLYNSYEMVRIGVNPKSGRLTGCNVFYFPLLDDHGTEDQPLTQEQAEEIARSIRSVSLEDYKLKSAQVNICLPNWNFTEYSGGNLQYSEVSRWAWHLTYEKPESEFVDELYIDIDRYTGEVLGGDRTG